MGACERARGRMRAGERACACERAHANEGV